MAQQAHLKSWLHNALLFLQSKDLATIIVDLPDNYHHNSGFFSQAAATMSCGNVNHISKKLQLH